MNNSSDVALKATYSLDAETLFKMTEPYCRGLGDSGYEPFYILILELLKSVPPTVQPEVVQFARAILVDTAFDKLERMETLESTFLSLLTEMPDTIGQALANDMKSNAAQMWNLMQPHFQKLVREQLEPQRKLIEANFRPEENTWAVMPPGPERLRSALQVCRSRQNEHVNERGELIDWVAGWIDELIWTWELLIDTSNKRRDLFSSTQTHVLTRVLRAIYQPSCPAPCLPLSDDLRRSTFLPLFGEGQVAQECLDKYLREQLEAVPILPSINSSFIGERHDAPSVFWRPSRSEEEKGNTIYEVREVGVEHHGKILIKATVGIIQAGPESSVVTKSTEISQVPQDLKINDTPAGTEKLPSVESPQEDLSDLRIPS